MAANTTRGASGCCLGCFAFLAVACGLLTLLLIASDVGFGGLVGGLLMACLPVPIYLGLAMWIDRYEPEPPGLLAFAFFWGATVAVFISYLLNSLNQAAFYDATHDAAVASALGGVISAPVVEELSKGICLFLLFLWKRKEFDGIVDGVVYATMVALGFAMTENVQYYGGALSKGGDAAGAVFVLRGMLSPFSHPLFTSMTGIGVGWAAQSTRWPVKLLAPWLGLGMAMGLHAMWNLSATIQAEAWLLTYLFIMFPCALGVGLVLLFALQREGNLLRAHLKGEIPPERLRSVSSVFGRIFFSLGKLLGGGPARWLAAERYLQAASELAFWRDRQRRCLKSDPQEEAQLVTHLQNLQARLP